MSFISAITPDIPPPMFTTVPSSTVPVGITVPGIIVTIIHGTAPGAITCTGITGMDGEAGVTILTVATASTSATAHTTITAAGGLPDIVGHTVGVMIMAPMTPNAIRREICTETKPMPIA